MAKYSRIVFLQGEDFEKMMESDYIALMDSWENEPDVMTEYLTQWDNGEDDDMHDESSAGAFDRVHYGKAHVANTDDEGSFWFYKLSYNYDVRYACLERVFVS